MSRGQSAFNIVGHARGIRDTIHLMQSDVSETVSISSSERQVVIPELTKAEELAIKRSSASFAPIGQGGGENVVGIEKKEEEFITSWRPSNDLMMDIERATGAKQTTDWDDVGLEVSQQRQNPSVDLIPIHAREGTPDSVASSGNIRIRNGQGGHTYLNAANLQQNAANRTNSQTNMAKSTRAFVHQITSEYDMPSTSADHIELQEFQGSSDEKDGKTTKKEEVMPEKDKLFLPKCFLLMLLLMMVLAGIVAAVVLVDTDAPARRGQVIPDPITHAECPTKKFMLGDTLNFTCTYDLTHGYRKILENATEAHVIPKSRALADVSLDYSMTNDYGETTREFTFIGVNLTAKCSSAGDYDVIYRDKSGRLIHNSTVTIEIKASFMNTTFIQSQLEGDDCLKTVFDATCQLHNDCNNYHTTMYRLKAGREESLNRYMKCERNFTDADGYKIGCSATIPDNLVEDFVGLGCKMEATLPNNDRTKLTKPFQLPNCGIEQRCKTYMPPNVGPFNCTAKSIDRQRLDNATCDFQRLTNCFKPGRQIFSGIYKNLLNNLTCSNNQAVEVCRLSWCRDYNFIVKNEIPGAAICESNYDERTVTPPPERTTTAS